MDTETTFFQSDDIVVTNARFIVGSQTFAMRGITSVQAIKIPPSDGGSTITVVFGLIVAVAGFAIRLYLLGFLGVLLLGLGVWLAMRQKPIYAVVLRTAGGEVTAYQSNDWNYISQIIEALNQSIVSHG